MLNNYSNENIIYISIFILVVLLAGAGLIKLYYVWKEKREAAREDARENELWK